MKQLLIKRQFLYLFSGILFAVLNGCSSYFHQPTKEKRARLGEDTGLTSTLRTLPPPTEKLVAAVYKFRDQTGQYKPSENGINYSTAVTQGATNILLKALEESGWFVAIERENVSNLLNERKIIRSSMAQFKPENENLPPLLFAGIILEGGIVSYDANVITGGAGLKYFGAGGSAQYRQDRVTVYLRAVATKTGKILKTVYTSKTILSQSVNASLFRFVRFKRLMETETGYTTNEPSQMAVTEAIEKSVQSMIIEGVRDGLWNADAKGGEKLSAALKDYEVEQKEAQETDVYGARNNVQRGRVSIMPEISLLRYSGDYANPVNKFGFGAALNVGLTRNWNLQLHVTSATLAAKQYFTRDVTISEVNLQYRTLPLQKINPFIQIGGGVTATRNSAFFEFKGKKDRMINGGFGIEYALGRSVGLNIAGQYNYFIKDEFDSVISGSFNDSFWRATMGLSIYLGGGYSKKSKSKSL
jgi:curli production assembly/transport component CsgG